MRNGGCSDIGHDVGEWEPGTSKHVLRLEINGTQMSQYLDGALIVSASDASFLGAGKVGLWEYDSSIAISSFTITAL
jgi:hypothetical protein